MSTKASYYQQLNDPEWLRSRYETATAAEIAQELGCHRETVTRALFRCGIRTVRRTPTRYEALKDHAWLEREIQTKPMRQIADEIGCSYSGVLHAVRKFRIAVPGRVHRRHSETRSESVKRALREKYPNGRTGEMAANWRGGRRRTSAGYILAYAPDHPRAGKRGAVQEHILVAEGMLGRYLEPGEIVHHVNHVRDDNRPENLVVKKGGEHIREHFDAGRGYDALKAENARLRQLLVDNGIDPED